MLQDANTVLPNLLWSRRGWLRFTLVGGVDPDLVNGSVLLDPHPHLVDLESVCVIQRLTDGALCTLNTEVASSVR